MYKFSAFTSDLDRRPELRESMYKQASLHSDLSDVNETVSPDGKITTFEPVMA